MSNHAAKRLLIFLGIKIVIDKILGAIFPSLHLQWKIDDTAERSTDNLAVKENEQFKLNKMEYNFSNVLLILLVKYFYNRLRFNVFIDKSCKGTLFSITVYISEASITESKLTSTPLVCFLGCRKWALKRREAFIGIFLIIFKQSQLQMCCLSKLNSCVVVCSDDEHSNCPPERHRHVSIVLHAVADCH